MRVTTSLRYGLARMLLGAKAAEIAGIPFFSNWTKTSWLEPTFDRLTREGTMANGAVFACINALSFAYPEPPLLVKNADGEHLPQHPLQALLRRPNPIMGEAELALFVIAYMATGGQCYLEKRRSAAGRVVQLWPYHAGQISPIPSASSWIAEYEYDAGDGNKQRLPATDIIHLKWPAIDPTQPWMALPPLRAVAREVDTDSEATRYLYALLKNDATPRTVLRIPSGTLLSELHYQRLRDQFSMRHGGDNRGNVAVVEGGADITRMSLNLQELAFDALRKVPEARICAAFRVSPIVAGLSVGIEHMTYSNYREAVTHFTEGTLVPLWRLVAGELERDLVPEFGDTELTITHDTGKVAALQENEDAKYTRVIAAWDKGLMTRNEGRAMLGLKPVAELSMEPGDDFKGTQEPVTVQGQVIDVTPQRPQLEAAKYPYPLALKERKRDATETLQEQMERELREYLTRQYARAEEAL